MMSKISSRPLSPFIRSYGNCKEEKKFNVAVCGAAGGIGQPLSLLLKLNPLVGELRLFDIKGTPGVGADLSHIESPANVKHFNGPEQLKESLCGADVIVVSAGVPRKPGMTRDDLFAVNAGIVKSIAEAAVEIAPEALLALITNPVNSMVAIASEIYKKANKLDPKRIFGVTLLDVVRANTFTAAVKGMDAREVNIPVIGGHAGKTIIPIFSQSTPEVCLDDKQIKELIPRIQEAGTEVVKAKAGAGSATLSTAYAASRFANSLLLGLSGKKDIVECAYVQSSVSEAEYFATPLLLGPCGLEKNLGLGELNELEKRMVAEAVPILKKNIAEGIAFANKSGDDKCHK